MKLFSRFWKSSKKPRKQRKYRLNAPLHIRKRMLKAHLSKQLRKKYNRRSFSVRTGDKVRITRGKYKGKQGSVESVDLKRLKITVSGVEITKNDGSKVHPLIDPSNVEILEFKVEDKMRKQALERSKKKNGKKTLKEA